MKKKILVCFKYNEIGEVESLGEYLFENIEVVFGSLNVEPYI